MAKSILVTGAAGFIGSSFVRCHDRRYLLDSRKLRRELGWEPEISFEDGLRASVDWSAANRDWWNPLRERVPVRGTQWT